jgi:hypothetical protein
LANASIGAQRAYFKLVGITMGDPSTTDTPDEVRTFAMNFGNRESGISELPTPGSQASTLHSGWYTLDGRKTVNGTSANHQWPKGIYIKNGRKIVIK